VPADLFQPYQLGGLTLANRVAMAPMTRNRDDAAGVATPLMATYYQQRATAGLIITESTPVSTEGVGYPFTPGIASDAQAEGWLQVTDAAHAVGGHSFVQLQHCGRISHPSLLPANATPVAFGAPFVANPDLVRRYRERLPLNEPDPSTFHTGGETGYTDYRPHVDVQAAVA
jgi:N-ethylmaleimide reductase